MISQMDKSELANTRGKIISPSLLLDRTYNSQASTKGVTSSFHLPHNKHQGFLWSMIMEKEAPQTLVQTRDTDGVALAHTAKGK